MDVTLLAPDSPLPVDRGYAMAMIVNVFKGRREVAVHLFRGAWDPAEEADYPWDALIGPPLEDQPGDAGNVAGSRRVLLESFTDAERRQVAAFLQSTYAGRVLAVHSCPLEFPIPAGLTALSDVPPGKTVGRIDFGRIKACTLPFAVCGLYDLAQHKPLVEAQEDGIG